MNNKNIFPPENVTNKYTSLLCNISMLGLVKELPDFKNELRNVLRLYLDSRYNNPDTIKEFKLKLKEINKIILDKTEFPKVNIKRYDYINTALGLLGLIDILVVIESFSEDIEPILDALFSRDYNMEYMTSLASKVVAKLDDIIPEEICKGYINKFKTDVEGNTIEQQSIIEFIKSTKPITPDFKRFDDLIILLHNYQMDKCKLCNKLYKQTKSIGLLRLYSEIITSAQINCVDIMNGIRPTISLRKNR